MAVLIPARLNEYVLVHAQWRLVAGYELAALFDEEHQELQR